MNAFICLLSSLTLALSAGFAVADDITGIAIPNQPKVPGVLRLHVRERQEVEPKSGEFEVIEGDIEWNASETAIIVCDMWEDHPCKMSAHRVDVMAPEMNRVISAARSLGVTIIHSPSSGMEHYEKTPQRRRIKAAPEVKSPVPIEGWCYLDPEREAEYPIPYSHSVVDDDGISDNGVEIYNFIEQQGIKNVVLMGVHTHYCVLGRSFGIRQMVRLGKNVVLARDLTDAMYDPRKPPYVSHARGTELAVEHIEKYWCPSILGSDLTEVIPGSADVKEPNTATNDE